MSENNNLISNISNSDNFNNTSLSKLTDTSISKKEFMKDTMKSKTGGCIILLFLIFLLNGITNTLLAIFVNLRDVNFYSEYQNSAIFFIFILTLIGFMLAIYLRNVSLSYLRKTGTLYYKNFKKSKYFNTLSMTAFGISILSFIILSLVFLVISIYALFGNNSNSSDKNINTKLDTINDNFSNYNTNDGDLNTMVNFIKKYYYTPQKINDSVILEDIQARKSIRFIYSVNDIDSRNLGDEFINNELFDIVKTNTCDGPLFKDILSKGIVVDYEYRFKDIYRIYSISKEHCIN